ncbi:MAG: DUF4346 domain-containing protein [bacterium]|nr:DUF4346 domain-containing protein [bacterium]MDW8321909.1 DUF4346 domain-containing protein [Armatimonadota bacterium]
MTQDEILRQLRMDLAQAFETPKCRRCGCLRDTLLTMREATANLSGIESEALQADIIRFLNSMEAIKYPCLGCDPCYPANAENRFLTAAEGVLLLPNVQRASCAFEVRTDDSWPVVAGEYIVLDHCATVAVSTLASTDLPEKLSRLRPHGLAIAGKTETENIGIDKVVKNIITNPCIRTLIIAGQEPKGHLTGQALLSLWENGVDEQQRIVGAKGKRPFLRNITAQEIEHFRQQVILVDMIGCDDAERIAAEAADRAQKQPCACPAASPREVATTSPRRLRAEMPNRPVKLDRSGYFVIIPQPDKKLIIVEHYDYRDQLLHVIEGQDARSLCATILEFGLASQLDHAAYLGRELMRAELSIRYGLPFVQDGA